MNLKNIKLVCLAMIFTCMNASATLITLESRNITGEVNSSDLLTSWGEQTSTITSSVVDNLSSFLTGRYTFNHLQIDLSIDRSAASWTFDFALDATHGAAVYLDGAVDSIANRTDDLWWGYNWNHSDVFTVTLSDLSRDNQVIDVYWAENCCNGSNSIRFTNDANQVRVLSVANLDSASIPEPTSIALFGLAVFGLAARRLKA
ncbi:MAG: CCXG family PEP-CTERM protein [Colwellia sp.]|nr:CCXG family PEP-CTERM protein [Colwellia sp.]